jgi:hypothetical protein
LQTLVACRDHRITRGQALQNFNLAWQTQAGFDNHAL